MSDQLAFFPNHADAKARLWADIRARQERVRQEARQAKDEAFRAWFRSRAREFGGVNSRNRKQITAEAAEYGRRAAEHVYRRNGYTDCGGDDCRNLVSPGFSACPDHTPITSDGHWA